MRLSGMHDGESVVAGLEIGTTKTCVVVGESADTGTGLSIVESPSAGVCRGEIGDFDATLRCVRRTINDAEEKSRVRIRGVYLAVTGAHIRTVNVHTAFMLPRVRRKIDGQDLKELQANARTTSIPVRNAFLHSIPLSYQVDGRERGSNPIGMRGRRLEGNFHVVHGEFARIQRSIRCVKELGLDLEDVVFAPLASSLAVHRNDQKQSDTLVIDIGGGTTGYVLYLGGAVKQSGVVGLGGDHITETIARQLGITTGEAERLKILSGREAIRNSQTMDRPYGDEVALDVIGARLDTIISSELKKIFELLRRQLEGVWLPGKTSHRISITGGSSCLKTIRETAEAVLSARARIVYPRHPAKILESPRFATAIGLLQYHSKRRLD